MRIKVIRVLHQNVAKNISYCQQIRQILDESQGVRLKKRLKKLLK
jgi:hypothetical protein